MNDSQIHVFNHHAMATVFQVRLAGVERDYAAQAARALFDRAEQLESLLSRFRESSEISQAAALVPGEKLRLSQPVFACLEIARDMEAATGGAFSATPAARRDQPAVPRWTLLPSEQAIRCDAGRLDFDLGAIGKGFALDCMAAELADWECPSFLLVAGGSTIVAGAPPNGAPGWSSGVGDGGSERHYWLANGSLSGSGVAVKRQHILNPRTGQPAQQRNRAWAIAPTGAVSDALSTACMVLAEDEIAEIMAGREDWLVLLNHDGQWRQYGGRKPPPLADESFVAASS